MTHLPVHGIADSNLLPLISTFWHGVVRRVGWGLKKEGVGVGRKVERLRAIHSLQFHNVGGGGGGWGLKKEGGEVRRKLRGRTDTTISLLKWFFIVYFQIILNMRRRTTDGQSTLSVVITLVGKTTDFLANYLLLLPARYVVMTYFSCTLAFINGIQVIFYEWKGISCRKT